MWKKCGPFRGGLAAVGVVIRCRRRVARRQIEADVHGLADLGAAFLKAAILAIDRYRDLVTAERQTTVEVVALLVGLDLIVALDVFALLVNICDL